MSDDTKPPKSRPEPQAGPNVYGGRWGDAGKQGDPPGERKVDRPDRVKAPDEAQGSGDGDAPPALPDD